MPAGTVTYRAPARYIPRARYPRYAAAMAAPMTRHPPPTTVTFTGAGGLRLVGEFRGDTAATPIVFVHGSGQSRHSWATSAATLAADGWRTVTFDLRGHGNSERAPGGAYSFDDIHHDLVAVLETLERPPVLVGASMGGLLSLLAAGESRCEVRAIVLADSAHRGNDAAQAAMVAFARSAAEGYASVEDASRALAALGTGSGGPPTPDRLRHVLRESGGRYWWPWDPAFGAFWSSDHEDHAERVLAAARAVSCPILFVRGTESPLVTEEIAAEFCDRVPGARRVDLHGVGHMLTGDDNDVFIEAMRPFLREITARP